VDYTKKDCIDCGDGTTEWSASERIQESLDIQLVKERFTQGPNLVTDLEVKKGVRSAVYSATRKMEEIGGVLSNYQLRQRLAAENECELAP